MVESMTDSARRWVPSSEPVSVTSDPLAARAMLLSNDASVIVGWPVATDTGLDLYQANLATPIGTGRQNFAAAWSRTSQALYLAGGVDPQGVVQSDVWTWRPSLGEPLASVSAGPWHRATLDPQLAPSHAVAAAYSPRDWRLWVVDEGPDGRRLLRIDPATGELTCAGPLPFLEEFEDVWLTTVPDGRVLLAGKHDGFKVVLMDVVPFVAGAEPFIVGALAGPGELVAMPQIRRGLVSLALEITQPDGVTALRVASVAVEELEAQGSGGKVTVCHVPRNHPEAAHTIRVAGAALRTHLSHGDVLGQCYGAISR